MLACGEPMFRSHRKLIHQNFSGSVVQIKCVLAYSQLYFRVEELVFSSF